MNKVLCDVMLTQARRITNHLPFSCCRRFQLSLEERTELLCRVTERFSGLEVHQRPDFLQRRRLEPRYMDLQATELALSTRRSDISSCCDQVGTGNHQVTIQMSLNSVILYIMHLFFFSLFKREHILFTGSVMCVLRGFRT